MGSWSEHVEAEAERIAAPLRAAGFDVAIFDAGWSIGIVDRSRKPLLAHKIKLNGAKCTRCNVYAYLPGHTNYCPKCQARIQE